MQCGCQGGGAPRDLRIYPKMNGFFNWRDGPDNARPREERKAFPSARKTPCSLRGRSSPTRRRPPGLPASRSSVDRSWSWQWIVEPGRSGYTRRLSRWAALHPEPCDRRCPRGRISRNGRKGSQPWEEPGVCDELDARPPLSAPRSGPGVPEGGGGSPGGGPCPPGSGGVGGVGGGAPREPRGEPRPPRGQLPARRRPAATGPSLPRRLAPPDGPTRPGARRGGPSGARRGLRGPPAVPPGDRGRRTGRRSGFRGPRGPGAGAPAAGWRLLGGRPARRGPGRGRASRRAPAEGRHRPGPAGQCARGCRPARRSRGGAALDVAGGARGVPERGGGAGGPGARAPLRQRARGPGDRDGPDRGGARALSGRSRGGAVRRGVLRREGGLRARRRRGARGPGAGPHRPRAPNLRGQPARRARPRGSPSSAIGGRSATSPARWRPSSGRWRCSPRPPIPFASSTATC